LTKFVCCCWQWLQWNDDSQCTDKGFPLFRKVYRQRVYTCYCKPWLLMSLWDWSCVCWRWKCICIWTYMISLTEFLFTSSLFENDYLQLIKCICSFGHWTGCWNKKLYDAITGLSVVDRNRLRRAVVGIKVLLLFLHNHLDQISSFSLYSSLFLLYVAIGYISIDSIRFLYNRYLNSNKFLYFLTNEYIKHWIHLSWTYKNDLIDSFFDSGCYFNNNRFF
jgi:hypothetical protein